MENRQDLLRQTENNVSSAPVHIKLLGPLEIMVHGKRVDGIRYDKARALLAYMLMHPNVELRRAAVSKMFWPEASEQRARQSLRQAIATIRRELQDRDKESRYFRVSRQTMAYSPHTDLQTDVERFLSNDFQGSEIEKLHQAIDTYRGKLMEQFHLSGCDEFNTWIEKRRQQVHSAMLDKLDTLASIYQEQGNTPKAIECYSRLTDMAPWDEQYNYNMMSVLAQSGQRNAAIQHFERYRTGLKKELGTEPDTKMQQLYSTLQSGDQLGTITNIASQAREQQFKVTILHCRLANDMEIPPQQLIHLRRELRSVCKGIIEAHNGQLDQHSGIWPLAYFGLREGYSEQDRQRDALSAALEILNAGLSHPITLGLHSDTVLFVSNGQEWEVAGSATSIAAILARNAKPNEMLMTGSLSADMSQQIKTPYLVGDPQHSTVDNQPDKLQAYPIYLC